jgi:hypothetical protein
MLDIGSLTAVGLAGLFGQFWAPGADTGLPSSADIHTDFVETAVVSERHAIM